MRVNIVLIFEQDAKGYARLMDLISPIVKPTKRSDVRSSFSILYHNLEPSVAIAITSMIISNKFDGVVNFYVEYAS